MPSNRKNQNQCAPLFRLYLCSFYSYGGPAPARESYYRDSLCVQDQAMAEAAQVASMRSAAFRRRVWPEHWQQVGA